jgi:hypothetical protein
MNSSCIPTLRRYCAALKDSEAKIRVLDAVRFILENEGKQLYAAGELNEALVKFAEAEGAPDPASSAKERTTEARKKVLELLADPKSPNLDTGGPSLSSIVALGPWAMPALIELLGDRDRHGPSTRAAHLLSEMRDDAIPGLICALTKGSDLGRANACNLLGEILVGDNGDEYPRVLTLLKSLATTASNSQQVRTAAREALKRITVGNPDDK